MSFSVHVKKEITASLEPVRHCQLAQLCAIINNAVYVNQESIQLHTENYYLALNFCSIVDAAFGIKPLVCIRLNSRSGKRAYYIFIKDTRNIARILNATGYWEFLNKYNSIILMRECCKRAYLKSTFVSNASISDPDKSYHLEFVFSDKQGAQIVMKLLEYFSLKPKLIKRKKSHVIYIKDGEKISEFLGLSTAHHSLLGFEGLRVFKNVSNDINRQVNCEAANIAKTARAFVSCQEDIILIERLKGLSYLSKPLREAAMLRLQFPSATLKEIGQMLAPPISKSGVNHRLRKISEIAEKLRGGLYG